MLDKTEALRLHKISERLKYTFGLIKSHAFLPGYHWDAMAIFPGRASWISMNSP